MNPPRQRLLSEIEQFEPQDGNWLPLDDLLAELFEHEIGPAERAAVFDLFERYPEDDGEGVLWSGVHELEATEGYEPDLVASVRRTPSLMGLAMIRRLQNSGVNEVNGLSLSALIHEIVDSPVPSDAVPEDAQAPLGAKGGGAQPGVAGRSL